MMYSNRKTLIEKTAMMSREEHSRLTNELVRNIANGITSMTGDIKSCNNIHTFNRSVFK